MRIAVCLLGVLLCGCTHGAKGPSNSSNAAAKSGGGNGAKSTGSAALANGNAAGAVLPDPHASTSPNVGREAGVGDDPSSLQAADPQANPGATGKPGPAQKQ